MTDLIPAEEPGGMTWQEVKDFLDHMRETCLEDRQRYKLEARQWKSVADTLADALRQMIPGTHYRRKLRAEALARYDGSLGGEDA